MGASAVQSQSFWRDSASLPAFGPINADLYADVVVIGGGVTGLTTAYLLSRAGRSVVLLERQQCASGNTDHTSAHLTLVTDARAAALTRDLGHTHAQAVWDAGAAALSQIAGIVHDERIDADLVWVDGYLYSPPDASENERASLAEDAEAARAFGFEAEFVDAAPWVNRPAVRFPGQARIQPHRYLAGVARAAAAAGTIIFEHSEVTEFLESPRRVRAGGHTVACDTVVMATHTPLQGWSSTAAAALFQTKLAPYSSYVLAARVAKGSIPDALWWDTADPYQYVRVEPHDEADVVIIGGEDHKTGQEADPESRYERLVWSLLARLPEAHVTHRWSGQLIETADGLPYIGQSGEHQFAATGFCGNGLTFGTIAAMMITDQIQGRPNPWTDLFHPGRTVLSRGLWDYVKENADYPYYLVRDFFRSAEGRSVRSVRRGEGRVIELKGRRVAAYRDEDGRLTLRSAVCTHMGCLVRWNTAEQTWDCPCHGSRFAPDGHVIAGPAETPLSDEAHLPVAAGMTDDRAR